MILVCDRTVSGRAAGLRERIFAAGIPAAVSAFSQIREFLPVPLFMTFSDVFDELRRLPYDRIFTVAVGPGFVNSALSACRAATEEEAVNEALRRLPELLSLPENAVRPFGVYLTPMLFCGGGFVEARGRIVPLTGTEERMLRYLAACSDEEHPAGALKIQSFCMPAGKQGTAGAENRIAAHVYSLNRKLGPVLESRLLREKRGRGYYAVLP